MAASAALLKLYRVHLLHHTVQQCHAQQQFSVTATLGLQLPALTVYEQPVANTTFDQPVANIQLEKTLQL
jgi:hypothetical protein